MDDRRRGCFGEAVYQEFRPAPRLQPFVECGWLRSGSATPSLRVIPDGCVDVFVTAQGDVMIAGPAHTFYDLPAEGTGSRLHVRVLFEGPRLVARALAPGDLVMMRKQLITVKSLAEREAAAIR
jgi:hypothetical protein